MNYKKIKRKFNNLFFTIKCDDVNNVIYQKVGI